MEMREGRSNNRFVEYFKGIINASDLRKMERLILRQICLMSPCIVMVDMKYVWWFAMHTGVCKYEPEGKIIYKRKGFRCADASPVLKS